MAPIKAEMNENGEMRRQADHENRGGTVPLGGSPGAFVFASPFGPRITLAPPDAGGGSGGGEGGAAPVTPPAGDAAPPASADPVAEKPSRPDYIPENLWDAEKGFKSEDFNALVARDAEHSARAAQVPESADKYEFKLPHDFAFPDGVEVKDGEMPINADDPRVAAARDFALANQFSQAQFEGLIAMGVNLDLAEQSALKGAMAKEVEKLGAKGNDRIAAVKAWVGAKLPGDQAEALLGTLYNAKQIEAVETLMRLNRGAVPGSPGAGRDSAKPELSDEEYSKMTPTERINYARQHSKK